MRPRRLCNILCLLLLSVAVYAADSTKVETKPVQESKPKAQIYGGMTLKLDIGAAALTAALSNGKLQQFYSCNHHIVSVLSAKSIGGNTFLLSCL